MACIRLTVVLGFIFFNHQISCFSRFMGWHRDTTHDGVIPTSGGYKPDVTTPSILQCARLCKNTLDPDCTGFVYVSDSFTCQLHNTTWIANLNIANVVSASFYTLLWSTTKTCSVGWTRYGDSCYLFSTSKLQFDPAQIYCQTRNSHLVHIEDQVEDEFITELCRDKRTNATEGVCWLGMTHNVSVTDWYYTDTGTIPGYTPWNTGEPNGIVEAVYCATINGYHSYSWTDDTCTWVGYAICETGVTIS